MRSRPLLSLMIAAGCAAFLPGGVSAQVPLGKRQCEGVYAQMTLKGVLLLERWNTAASYRYYGLFQDPLGNVYELEVMTPNLEGGVGSTWVNSMRHRETFIELQVSEQGFVVRTEDGVAVTYTCGAAPGVG